MFSTRKVILGLLLIYAYVEKREHVRTTKSIQGDLWILSLFYFVIVSVISSLCIVSLGFNGLKRCGDELSIAVFGVLFLPLYILLECTATRVE